jgi:hypothetical protein
LTAHPQPIPPHPSADLAHHITAQQQETTMITTALASHASPTTVQPINHARSHTRRPITFSSTHTLAMARDDIHHAITAADDHHLAVQHALSARDNAAEVLTHPGASAAELQDAGYYFADAEAIIAHYGADPDTA